MFYNASAWLLRFARRSVSTSCSEVRVKENYTLLRCANPKEKRIYSADIERAIVI